MGAEAEPAPILRVPPHSIEAEEQLIGSVLVDPEAMASVVDVVRPEDFYRSAHVRTFEVFKDLFARAEPCDATLILREIERRGWQQDALDVKALARLSASVVSGANARHYAEIVREKSLARGIIRAGQEMARAAHDGEGRGDEILDYATGMLRDLAVASRSGRSVSVKDILSDAMAEIDGEQDERCVFTGFRAVDDVVGALVPGSLAVLGARPSMGKTAFALNVATSVALSHGPVLFFSIEMTKAEIAKRLLATAAGVDLHRMRDGKMLSQEEYEALTRGLDWLRGVPLLLDDKSAPSPEDIRAEVMRQQQRQGIRLVVVDYLDLIRPPESRTIRNRENEVAAVAKAVKAVAKDCGVPILALAQLSRESAKGARGAVDPGMPTLTDLRHSGEIEQVADVVMFLHRPNYYTKAAGDVRDALVGVRKNRNGKVGDARLDWCAPIQKFQDVQTGGA